jgi:oxygen-independent coproporphyrinogen-3 oxidase
MADGSTAPDLGVYVHVPFCERICPYCDFAVEAVGRLAREVEAEFVDLVVCDLDLAIERFGLAGRRLATLYLGGGTPSLLAPESVARVLAAVRARFEGAPEEVTLELNPGVTEIARVPGFRDAGVTRVSVGVQSLDDETLRRLGRAHKAAEAHAGLAACLAAGFASVSADLIFGAPHQSEAQALADVERVCDLGVPHVSAYALTLEPGTPFHAASRRGKLALPDEDTALSMSRLVRARLVAAGRAQYEISSFARPGHRARHNERYWTRADVLGIGPAAASHVGERRTRNLRARGAWARAIATGAAPFDEDERIDAAAARRETLYLGLRRLEGVARAAFLRRFGGPPEQWFERELERLRERELVCDEAGRLRLTERGILFADEVFLEFVEP